jgi:TPR repeat protein
MRHLLLCFVLTILFGVPELMAKTEDKKIKEIIDKAESGDVAAQRDLGAILVRGEGIAKDLVQGWKWYQRAAEGGDAQAQVSLAVRFTHGDGVEKDMIKGAKWFLKAAEQGDAYAQRSIASMYVRGSGVPKNFEEAYAWFSVAATGSFPEREFYVLENKMSPDQVSRAQTRSSLLFREIEARRAKKQDK